MNRSSFSRLKARPEAWRKLARHASDKTADFSRASALVFAPHQDDETLGCGGTIIKKCRAGTRVGCVFMTDGHTSHQAFISPEELTELRKAEALEATDLLGVPFEHVHFLGFRDGELGAFHAEALKRVSELLARYQPQQVFVPYRNDGTSDHESTFRIVSEAVRASKAAISVCEYPVWFWNQWPWVSLELRPNRDSLKSLQRSLRAGFGRRAYNEFRASVYVGDVLPLKRKALEEHRSQMSVLKPDTSWPTLHDVSRGDFLDCFFQDIEVFRVTNEPQRNEAG